MYTKVMLTVIAVFLGIIALRPLLAPARVEAQLNDRPYLYIEPRTTMLRRPDGQSQVEGKVVIDKRTGDVWGYPTSTSAPYPVNLTETRPPLSKPMYLGKFDFSAMTLQEK